MSAFGAGTTCKAAVQRYTREDLSNLALWADVGTGDTMAVAEDATYGTYFTSTLSGSDNDNGSIYLRIATVSPKLNGGGRFRARVALDEAATDNIDAAFGLSSGLATGGTAVFSDTASTLASQDALIIYKLAESLFWRAQQRNAGVVSDSGVTTTAVVDNTWYELDIEWKVYSDGVHAKFKVNGTTIYTIGFGSSVAAVTITSWTAMYLGVHVKATNTNAEVIRFQPLLLEIENSGT